MVVFLVVLASRQLGPAGDSLRPQARSCRRVSHENARKQILPPRVLAELAGANWRIEPDRRHWHLRVDDRLIGSYRAPAFAIARPGGICAPMSGALGREGHHEIEEADQEAAQGQLSPASTPAQQAADARQAGESQGHDDRGSDPARAQAQRQHLKEEKAS
jgi:hypothetical protein